MIANERDPVPIGPGRAVSHLEIGAEKISVMIETSDAGIADAAERVHRIRVGET